MSLEYIVVHFGYPAIAVGTFFEGEVVLILGGFAAHRGYLSLPLVMAAAFLGSLLGDQFYFFMGRRHGRSFLARHPDWNVKIERFNGLVKRFGTLFILLFRFMYGLRTVSPFAIGLSEIPTAKFVLLNAASAAVWSVALGALGYFFGRAMEIVLEDVKKYEIAVMVGLVAVAVIVYLVKRFLNRDRTR